MRLRFIPWDKWIPEWLFGGHWEWKRERDGYNACVVHMFMWVCVKEREREQGRLKGKGFTRNEKQTNISLSSIVNGNVNVVVPEREPITTCLLANLVWPCVYIYIYIYIWECAQLSLSHDERTPGARKDLGSGSPLLRHRSFHRKSNTLSKLFNIQLILEK